VFRLKWFRFSNATIYHYIQVYNNSKTLTSLYAIRFNDAYKSISTAHSFNYLKRFRILSALEIVVLLCVYYSRTGDAKGHTHSLEFSFVRPFVTRNYDKILLRIYTWHATLFKYVEVIKYKRSLSGQRIAIDR